MRLPIIRFCKKSKTNRPVTKRPAATIGFTEFASQSLTCDALKSPFTSYKAFRANDISRPCHVKRYKIPIAIKIGVLILKDHSTLHSGVLYHLHLEN